MAMHMLITDESGEARVVFDSNEFPYCQYVQCRECFKCFCDNGCDDELGEECPASDLRLFDFDALGNING